MPTKKMIPSCIRMIPMLEMGSVLTSTQHFWALKLARSQGWEYLFSIKSALIALDNELFSIEENKPVSWHLPTASEPVTLTEQEKKDFTTILSETIQALRTVNEEWWSVKKGNDKVKVYCYFA